MQMTAELHSVGDLRLPAPKTENPGIGLNTNNFKMVASNGFGDAHNGYPHAMIWFGGLLIVGTTRAGLAYRGRWLSETNPERLGQLWPVRIPEELFGFDLGAEIWAYNPVTQHWIRRFKSPIVRGIDEIDVPLTIGFRAMVIFQGPKDKKPCLYIPTWGSHQTPKAVMLRTEDGITFDIVSQPGLGFPDPYQPRAVRGLVEFNGRLFGSPAVGAQRMKPNSAGSLMILTTTDPASNHWDLASSPHFDDFNNLTAFHMAVYNDHLYVSTLNEREGFQVWKTKAEGNPPYQWDKIMDHGAGRGRLNQIGMTLYPFNGYLYLGSAIQNGGCDWPNKVGPAGVEIIRFDADDNWELIVGEARVVNSELKIPLSGLGPGFENPFAGYLWSMCEHEGWLYASTFSWSIGLKFTEFGANIPYKLSKLLCLADTDKWISGFDLWRTRDGLSWVPVTRDGFGNVFNYGARTLVSTPYGLFVGAANPYGPDVAVKRVAGWRYETNLRGGLEIWQGSTRFGMIRSDNKPMSCKLNSDPIDPIDAIDPIEEFYQQTDYRSIGFWRNNIDSIIDACENLLDEVLGFLTQCYENTVVIGNSSLAQKHYLQLRLNASLTFINRNSAGHRSDGAFSNAIVIPDLGTPTLSNKELCVIFKELSQGGRMCGFEYLRKGQLFKFGRLGQRHTVKELEQGLKLAGFSDIEIIDVTSECISGFEIFRSSYINKIHLTIEQPQKKLQQMQGYFKHRMNDISQCVLYTAVRCT